MLIPSLAQLVLAPLLLCACAPTVAPSAESPAATTAPTTAPADSMSAVVTDLAARAAAKDIAFFKPLMADATDDQINDMISRISKADLPATYKDRILSDDRPAPGGQRLNYHDISHFQVDLRPTPQGTWQVTRLWFCR